MVANLSATVSLLLVNISNAAEDTSLLVEKAFPIIMVEIEKFPKLYGD